MKVEKQLFIRLSIIGLFIILSFFIPYIFIFFIPGILLFFIPLDKKIGLTKLLIYTIGLSISFWIISFWWLKIIPLTLTDFSMAVTLISLAISFFLLYKNKTNYEIEIKCKDIFLIILFLIVLLLRLIPLITPTTAAGADMSMHTYITETIINADGIPKNYLPILNITKFDTFPVGFHMISALVSLASDIPAYKSTLLITGITFFLLTISLYLFVERFCGWKIASFSSLIFSFLTLNPQGFVYWGGTPTILALSFLILFIDSLYEIGGNKRFIIPSAIFLSAILLTHTIIFVQSVYLVGFSFLVYLFFNKKIWKKITFNWILVIILFIVFSLPYLTTIDISNLNSNTLNWIKQWVTYQNPSTWGGTIQNSLWTIPGYVLGYILGTNTIFSLGGFSGISLFSLNLLVSVLGIFTIGGFILLSKKDKLLFFQYLTFLIIGFLLILNAKYWLLPFSFLIYPERVAVMMIIPLILFFSISIDYLIKIFGGKLKRFSKIIFLIIILITLVFSVIANSFAYVGFIKNQSPVTPSDLKAIKWLENQTNKYDVIVNNYGDAGLWIPAIIFRPITYPHVNVYYLYPPPQFTNPDYVYIGKKCVYNCELKNSDFQNNSAYHLVYSKENVYIYKRVK